MPNKMERFTQRARRALSLAQEAAESLSSASIDSEHLLLGLISDEDAAAAQILSGLGVERSQVADLARGHSRAKPAAAGPPELDLSDDTKRSLELAVDEARRMGHNHIGSEHLLLGLIRLQGGGALEILLSLNLSTERIRQQVAANMSERAAPTPPLAAPESPRSPDPGRTEYFLLRTASRSSGQISQLAVDLSPEVKEALEEALKEIGHTGFLELEERHLLLGLLHNREGPLRRFLRDADIDLGALVQRLRRPADD